MRTKLDLKLSVSEAVIKSSDYTHITVDMEKAEVSEVLDYFSIEEIIGHFGIDALLDGIGIENCRGYFNLKDDNDE